MSLPIEKRIDQAEKLWAEGDQAKLEDDYRLAYQLYTQAHDLVVDCAKHHQRAHKKLRTVTFKVGRYGEFVTDNATQLLAPLGIFELVSYLAKTEGFGSELCKRNRKN